MPDWFDAVLLGIIEGLTEFLPVSSTGHLILLGDRLGLHSDGAKALEVVIQVGAIAAVAVLYRRKLSAVLAGLLRGDRVALRLLLNLAIAFTPAAVIGLLLHRTIKEHLFGPTPVAWALIAGGVVMIAIEARRRRRGVSGVADLDAVSPRQALVVGLCQCFALWPGASRSMATIVGGQVAGLSTATAAEFSFLLAIPTLGAAAGLDLVQHGDALLADGGVALVTGLSVSFLVAIAVISGFLRYLQRRGLAPFGWYRIALGLLVLWAATDAAL